jgi:electron transport complex protein RnfD
MEEQVTVFKEAEVPRLSVGVSPHIRAGDSVERIMWTVVVCLIPPLIWSIFLFGIRSLLITLVCVLGCVATEWITQKALKRPITVKDGSAVITGILLAYTIPPGVPIWTPILGCVVAIYIAKQLMGGLGYNIFNPALIGRAFLVATFPVAMTSAWVRPEVYLTQAPQVDAISSATPLYIIKHYGLPALFEKYGSQGKVYLDFLFGSMPGCIGETSALLILIGGLYLLYKGYITWHIPVSMIVTVGVLSWIFGGEGFFQGDPIIAVLTGGVMLGAFFMATDYVTSPNYSTGKIIFGIGAGALTVLIRLKGGYPEGVCYAILLMNPLTPALDQWFRPKRFAPPKGGLK